MGPRITRRRLIAGGIAAGVGALGLPAVREYLDLLAPGAGHVWGDLGPQPAGTVAGPYGDATVVFDGEGVPHIEADDEAALQYAHGYVQGHDRLFQLDLFRRQLRGRLSAVAGEATVETDEFHLHMDFAGAAEASAAAIAGTETAAVLEAFAAGVNAAREDFTAPVETSLLGYEIAPWSVTDSLLIEKLMGWELTGSFRTLRRSALAEHFGAALVDDLHPARFAHDVPILEGGGQALVHRPMASPAVPRAAVDWLSAFEPVHGQGSNSWVVSGAHTASGGPILANDPHLALTSPPVWYEVALETPAFATRGVTFPGTPFVVIGRNRDAAWGFTNVPADVMDFYRYEVDGDEYRVGGDWFAFDTVARELPVAGAGDRTVETRRTVHGPFIERHGAEVALQWTGLGATRTVRAVRALQFVDDHASLLDALDWWDLPPQNLVYADAGGRTRYHLVGQIPIRRTDGEPVRGDRVFDGSAGEGAWSGFEPYGQPTWEGFVPRAELPQAVDPPVVSTANQRVMDEPPHYLAEIHAMPYRAMRLVDRLGAAVDAGGIEPEGMVALQQDVHDELAATLVPEILEHAGGATGDVEAAVSALAGWDHAMAVDAWAPVVFELFLEAFRDRVFSRPLEEAGFDAAYVPSDHVLATLPGEHPWFAEVGERGDHVVAALELAADRADGHRSFGAFQRSRIDHPFGVGFLNYPRRAMPGSPRTLKNFRRDGPVGAGWQQVVDLGTGEAVGRLAGGNVGRRLSPHYADQLQAWIDGEYKPIDWSPTERRRLEFGGSSA